MAHTPHGSAPFVFFDVQAAEPAKVAETHRVFVAGLSELLEDLGLARAAGEALGVKLWERMSAPGRHYHTPVHVLLILGQARALGLELSQATQLAIWFHDSIYDPKAEPGLNERASAAWLCEQLGAAGVEPSIVQHAAESIRWTTRLMDLEIPEEHALVLDLDLVGLACAPGCFDRQSEAVRKEQGHKTDAEYEQGTLALFEALLERTSIYRTSAVAPFEEAARANLKRACAELAR